MRSTYDLYWLAGLFEGEASFSFKFSGNKNPQIQLTMTDEDIVEKARNILKLGTFNGPYKLPSGKCIWALSITNSTEVASVLMTLYPLMGNRRQKKFKELLQVWKNTKQNISWTPERVKILRRKAKRKTHWMLAEEYGVCVGTIRYALSKK